MKCTGIIALLALASGCGELDSNPRWLVDEPRLLAVRAEPAALPLDGRARLEALVLGADGERLEIEVGYRACNPWRFVRDPLVDCAAGVSLPLEGELIVRDVLERFPPPEQGAFPVSSLPVVAEARVGDQLLVTVEYVPLTADDVPQANPAIDGLLLDGQVNPTTYAAGRVYDLSASIELDVPEGAQANARVFVYVTGGVLDDPALDVSIDRSTGPSDVRAVDVTGWTAPAAGDVRLWLVAVDERGGVTWSRHELVVGSQ